MKVYVYQFPNGEFRYFNQKFTGIVDWEWKFLGIQEQPDIQPEKKTVVKEVEFATTYYSSAFKGYQCIHATIPEGGKNVKVTCEVEE